MELSTLDNALRSLLRRENLPPAVVETTQELTQKPAPEVNVARIPRYFEPLEKPRWDVLAVGFLIAQTYPAALVEQDDVLKLVLKECHANLEHLEPRIRRLVGKTLGALCGVVGPLLYEEFRAELEEIVECNITRSPEFEEINEEEYFSYFDTSIPLASPLSTPTSPHRLDDISGFKSLETCLLTFKYMVQGLGANFIAALEANNYAFFHTIVVRSVKHCNRHVRNVGFETIHTLHKSVLPPLYFSKNPALGHAITDCLVRGLQDPWSEVRLTASQATRSFVLFCSEQERELYYPKIVPRMCLNRHYVADGVKSYSRDTWTKVMGEKGRHIVAKYAAECVACYVEATDADNPFVREAACICIGEMAVRVDPEAVRPHANELLTAARICLQDDVFTVSDAACEASSQVVLAFPTESRSSLDKLIKWWTVHLSDDVWSVREDAAIALGKALRAYPTDEALRKTIVELARLFLTKAKDQPAMSQAQYDALIKSETAHSNKQRFSCCSFEPRQLKRVDHDQCTDHDHDPASGHALWAHTDGAIYLVRELCVGKETQNDAIELFPLLVDASILRHFPQTAVLQETLWKQLPAMGHALGKQIFKRHIELFFDPLALTLQGTHRLARFAAIECIKQLSQLIGPSIFRGRLDANDMWVAELAPHVTP